MRQSLRDLRSFSSNLVRDVVRVVRSQSFWQYLIVFFAMSWVFLYLPVIETAKWSSAFIGGMALGVVITQFHVVAEFFDPRDRRTLAHFLAFSWWLLLWYILLSVSWAFSYNALGRPDWMEGLPFLNMIRLWVIPPLAIILFSPLFVRDISLTIQWRNARVRPLVGVVLLVALTTLVAVILSV